MYIIHTSVLFMFRFSPLNSVLLFQNIYNFAILDHACFQVHLAVRGDNHSFVTKPACES
jgi:hypothetical protein